MAKVWGHTQGLKASQLKRLDNFSRRRFSPAELILPEQALDLSRLSHELGRQIGLIITRKGEVEQVLVGSAEHLPDPRRLRSRQSQSRLSGYILLRTDLDKGPIPRDFTSLTLRRWDLLAVLNVRSDGVPGLLEIMHLMPESGPEGDIKRLAPFVVGHSPENMALLIQALEAELFRLTPARDVGAEGVALLVLATTAAQEEALAQEAELRELARSAGLNVQGSFIQRRQKLDPRTVVGSGKLEEILTKALRLNAEVLVFGHDLSPSQAHNLALLTDADLKIIDRTQLILDIFAQRAQSREGKLQVEMAQMRYLLPRLGARDDGLSRLTGGIGGRGPGETRLEIDRRRVRERLNRLERELKNVSAERSRRRQRRQAGNLPVLSIVGYTNAGKSTLLNALTNSQVLAEDRLFATLDPTSRRLRFPQDQEVIITDTVGFIKDLPPDLRRAFAATLEELNEADLLLHVADASNPLVPEQIKAVEQVLDELDLTSLPCLLVFNKQDITPSEVIDRLLNQYGGLAVSALHRASLRPLVEKLEQMAINSKSR